MFRKIETHKNIPQKGESQKYSTKIIRLTKMFNKNETHKSVPQK